MKRVYCSLVVLLFTVLTLKAQAPASNAQPSAPQPVLLYLYSTVSDSINLDITEDRVRRLLPMVERLRSEHPQAHVSVTILFSGAVSQALDQRNAQTHIKDFILGYKKRGIVEIGYDGTDEPTYDHRPVAELPDGSTPESRWLARAAADEKFLTEARDPLTGTPLPGSAGGLQEMQRIFGEAAAIRGASTGAAMKVMTTPMGKPTSNTAPGPVSSVKIRPEVGDWELVPVIRRYNTKGILFGLPEVNPFVIPGFKGSVQGVSKLMSPEPNTSPELFWADNILRTSETSGGNPLMIRVLHGYEGEDGLKTFMATVERAKIHIVHMELASESDYFTPALVKSLAGPITRSTALSYAYAHPESPKVPADARLSNADVNAAYIKEQAALAWLAKEFFPANSGSRFLASSDFDRMTAPSTGYSVSVAALAPALADLLKKWGNDTFPPDYVLVEGHYLSLADMFQIMTDALAQLDRTGKLPQTVKVIRVYGPIEMPIGHGPNIGEVSVAGIAKVCSQLTTRLHDDSAPNPMPKNTIPPGVVVDGIGVNSAQFLKLMAQAMLNPVLDAKVKIRMTYMFPGAAEMLPKTRSMQDLGPTWTYKPAPLDIRALSARP